MGATTVYVTHDQLEAMQMGDKIVVMNHGHVEQWGTPQEIYDRPASMFVADFIGSPPMNFLRFKATFPPGADRVRLGGADIPIPPARDGVSGRELALGVRPEHVRLTDDGAYRAQVLATEYLGTTQIVSLRSRNGDLKARVPAAAAAREGETVGLAFSTPTLSLFDEGTGRALALDRQAARAAAGGAARG
jgi:multiple sugar transport system ATP-binding protein